MSSSPPSSSHSTSATVNSYNIRSPLTTSTPQSGSTTPITSYGSFPPRSIHPLSSSGIGDQLSAKLLKSLKLNSGRDRYGRLKGKGRELLERESSENENLFSREVEMREEVGEGSVDEGDLGLDDEVLTEQVDRSIGSSDRTRRREDEIVASTNFLRMRRSSRSKSNQSIDSSEVKQWGVIKMELMSRTWGKGLIMIFAGVYLISTLTSLEYNTTATIEPYFLSLLQSHSSLGAVYIVQNIVFAVGKPPMAKFLDVFGRAEGFALAASLYSLGFLLTASSNSATSFIVSRAIAALGGQGLQLASQVLIADTTTLTNRGLLTSTISLPWLITTWIGPPLGQFFQSRGEKGMRAGYGIFGILLPLAASVLIGTLMLEWRKVKLLASSPHSTSIKSRIRRLSTNSEILGDKFLDLKIELEAGRDRTLGRKMGKLWKELDIVGLITLTLSCGLILLPLSLAARRPASWLDPMIWSLISLGVVLFSFFVYYEIRISPIPLLPLRLMRNRTIICGSLLGLFHFLSQACYETFFTSFLQVARNHSPSSAAYIAQSYMFSASIFAIVAGLASKFTNRYKWIGIAGVLIHMVGTLLMSRARRLDTSTFEVVMSQVVGGIGGGLTTIAAQIGVQSVSTHQDIAIATAIFLTITQIGGAIGASVAGSVWSTLLPSRLRFHLPVESHHLIDEIVSSLTSALSYPINSPIRIAISDSYVDVQTRLNLLAIVLLFPAVIAICSMRDVNLEEREVEDESKILILIDNAERIDEEGIIESGSENSSLLGRHNRPCNQNDFTRVEKSEKFLSSQVRDLSSDSEEEPVPADSELVFSSSLNLTLIDCTDQQEEEDLKSALLPRRIFSGLESFAFVHTISGTSPLARIDPIVFKKLKTLILYDRFGTSELILNRNYPNMQCLETLVIRDVHILHLGFPLPPSLMNLLILSTWEDYLESIQIFANSISNKHNIKKVQFPSLRHANKFEEEALDVLRCSLTSRNIHFNSMPAIPDDEDDDDLNYLEFVEMIQELGKICFSTFLARPFHRTNTTIPSSNLVRLSDCESDGLMFKGVAKIARMFIDLFEPRENFA